MLPPTKYMSVVYSSYKLLIRLCYIKYNGRVSKNQRDYLNRSLTDDRCIQLIVDRQAVKDYCWPVGHVVKNPLRAPCVEAP